MITYFQALILGLLQGVTELFPISSLGHTVILPWLFNWHGILNSESAGESFYLPFVVVLHVATALALLIFYRDVWLRIIKGFFRSVATQKVDTPDGRLAWLLLLATIPAGITGLAFEHKLRVLFAKPLAAMIFLIINGFILLTADRYIQQHKSRKQSKNLVESTDQISEKLTVKRALIIGTSQVAAFFAGISRSGITLTAGLYSGLNTEDAARFSFLLATPIILGAGIVKLPDFFSNLDNGIRGQLLLGGLAAGIAAYFTVKYLDKYFQNKRLRPFGIYCIVLGLAMIGLGLIRGHF
ncbi:MAG TPA: undecaprenyl-diphosphate phosphatase [Candidatus Saccharimonadales bacterium]